MGEADDAQTVVPPGVNLVGRDDRVGPLHAEDDPERRRLGVGAPLVHMGFEGRPVHQDAHDALPLQLAVVGELAAGMGAGDLVRREVDLGVALRLDAGDDRRQADGNLGPPQVREADGAGGPALLGHPSLLLPDLVRAPAQVPVPEQGVVGEVEVPVDHDHRVLLSSHIAAGFVVRHAATQRP